METFSLAAVLLALVALGALVLLARRRQGSAAVDVRVVGRVALDGPHALYVVEAEGRRLLLGAHGNGVQLVTELAPVAPAAQLVALPSVKRA